jgi:hypothetical protein
MGKSVNWCLSSKNFGTKGDKGTPGNLNSTCP